VNVSKTPASKTAAPKAAAKVAKAPAAGKPADADAPDSTVSLLDSPVRPSTPTSTNQNSRPAVKTDPKLSSAWKSKAGAELTDAEVLAMPDSEYMNDKQVDFFRAKLTQLKEDILSNAGETTEHLREDTSIVPDPADRATIEEEHALELRTRDRERKLLKKIMQSLQRLESGEYGYCDETGEPIGLGRLIARPTATLSLEAQQRRELKQKMFGDRAGQRAEQGPPEHDRPQRRHQRRRELLPQGGALRRQSDDRLGGDQLPPGRSRGRCRQGGAAGDGGAQAAQRFRAQARARHAAQDPPRGPDA
jgi:DnaK suppressor protein